MQSCFICDLELQHNASYQVIVTLHGAFYVTGLQSDTVHKPIPTSTSRRSLMSATLRNNVGKQCGGTKPQSMHQHACGPANKSSRYMSAAMLMVQVRPGATDPLRHWRLVKCAIMTKPLSG